MPPERYILDTSALLTLIEDEDGAEMVEQIIRQQEVLIPWLCLLETHYISQQERDEAETNRRYALIKQLPATILWNIDEPTLLTAAGLKAEYRISLADSIIAAFAIQHQAILVHKDPEYETLSDQVSLQTLPYKKG